MRIIALLFTFVTLLTAQPPAGTYQLILGSQKPLAIGTPVWTNMGDTPCAYPLLDNNPKATESCMQEYHQGKIVEIFVHRHDIGEKGHYCYKIEFTLRPPGQAPIKVTRNTWFEDAYIFYNLPDKWALYSKYFVRLNW